MLGLASASPDVPLLERLRSALKTLRSEPGFPILVFSKTRKQNDLKSCASWRTKLEDWPGA